MSLRYLVLITVNAFISLTSSQSDAGWEEYYDYIFPADEANAPNLKLLAMAKMWKQGAEEND